MGVACLLGSGGGELGTCLFLPTPFSTSHYAMPGTSQVSKQNRDRTLVLILFV